MQKRTREILALVLLILLGVGAAGAMAWYILAGHNWNQAATHIDDMVGSMDGYTVVVFDGVVKDSKEKVLEQAEAERAKAQRLAAEQAEADLLSAEQVEAANAETAQAESGQAEATQAASGQAETTKADLARDAASEDSGKADASASAQSDNRSSSPAAAKPVPISAEDVAASYREKGAQVIVLDIDDLHGYEDPIIVPRNGKRIGVFSLNGTFKLKSTELKAMRRYMRAHDVGFTICMTWDKRALTRSLEGIDLLLLSCRNQIPDAGEYHGHTLCVGSPGLGEVQAVIMSPSGVLTSRVVTEL